MDGSTLMPRSPLALQAEIPIPPRNSGTFGQDDADASFYEGRARLRVYSTSPNSQEADSGWADFNMTNESGISGTGLIEA